MEKNKVKAIRILIVDDQPIYREGLVKVLEKDFKIIGQAMHGKEALEILSIQAVDVILLDINMPIMGGLETVPLIQSQFPHIAIIMLTIYDDPPLILQFLNLDVNGYILKEANAKMIRDAIESVAAGGMYYGSEVLKKASQQLKQQLTQQVVPPKLTERELTITRLIIQEFTAPEIASKLFISKETVDSHRKNIREKLQVRNTAGIVREALKWGLVDMESL